MPRYFTALSSVVVLGFALSAHAVVTSVSIEKSPAGREYKVYPTETATYAVLQGKHGLVLVKKTDVGVQHYAINAEGLNSVADADTRLVQPLIAKYGIDSAMAQLEQVVIATTGTEKAELIQPAVVSDENDRGGAKLILVDGTEQPRRRYPPRQPLPEENVYDGPMDPGMGYPGPVEGGGAAVFGDGGCVNPCGAPPPCVGGPCGIQPCVLCGPPPPPPICGVNVVCVAPPIARPYYGAGAPPVAVPLRGPVGRVPCDRRVYGNFCGY